jgi:cyclopropane fatty-acyl-phospholipid synthase-like methyltransferase
MENYDRYKTETAQSYEKKGIMDYLVRIPSDKKLLPLISQIKGKKILDVGPGTGLYTKFLLQNNEIIGIDRNPHLCRLPIKVLQADATRFVGLVGAKSFDMVFSTWMTEYLNPEQLVAFFKEARMALKQDGKIVTTIISKYGFGFFYITAAKMIRGIEKHNYTKKSVSVMLREAGFTDIEITNLNSWLCIPWAYMVVAS